MTTRIRDFGKINYLVDRKVGDTNWEGFGKRTHTDARKAVYKEILDGFRSLQEAEEHIKDQPEGNVIFTARGDEITFSMLQVVIGHIKKNKWYSPWGKTAFTDSVKHGIKMVEILLTPKQVDIVFNRFIDVGYDWVKFSPPVDRMKATPRRVSLLIPRHRVNEALSILESAIDITRDWVSDPTGRAEHKSTVNLYDRVKSASTDSVKSVPMTSKKPKDRRTAFYIIFWKPKSDPEISQPYNWDGPEAAGAYASLDAALRSTSELEEEEPEAFDIRVYSREERYEPDEDWPDLYGYWETIDGTEKDYDERGRII